MSDGTPDPDIGKLKKPRLVSKVTAGLRTCTLGTYADICSVVQVNKDLAERHYEHSSKGQLTVTLGGDHSLVSSDDALLVDRAEPERGLFDRLWELSVGLSSSIPTLPSSGLTLMP